MKIRLDRNVIELANEEYTRLYLARDAAAQGFGKLPKALVKRIQDSGTGYGESVNIFRDFAKLLDGSDAEYRRYMADVVNTAPGAEKLKLFTKFFEERLKKRGIKGNVSLPDIANRGSQIWKILQNAL